MISNNFKTVGLLAAVLVCTNMEPRLFDNNFMANASSQRNPQRPMRATDCAHALQRLREAAIGSSIIDKTQNKQHLMDALDHAEKICLDNVPVKKGHKKNNDM